MTTATVADDAVASGLGRYKMNASSCVERGACKAGLFLHMRQLSQLFLDGLAALHQTEQ